MTLSVTVPGVYLQLSGDDSTSTLKLRRKRTRDAASSWALLSQKWSGHVVRRFGAVGQFGNSFIPGSGVQGQGQGWPRVTEAYPGLSPLHFPSSDPGVLWKIWWAYALRPAGVRAQKHMMGGKTVVHPYGSTAGVTSTVLVLAREVVRLNDEHVLSNLNKLKLIPTIKCPQ